MRTAFSTIKGVMALCFCLVTVLMTVGVAEAQVSAENRTVVVIGEARVHGGNTSAARQEAISNSLVAAVARMIEDLLPVESLAKNFGQLNELLFNRTQAFIQDYKVLTEASYRDSYRVVVQATVSGEKIAIQLAEAGILRSQAALPRVLFLVAERNGPESMPDFWWKGPHVDFESVSEKIMAERLQTAGFEIIDHSNASGRLPIELNNYARADLTDREAAALGTALKADVVVLATATADISTNLMGSATRSFNAEITGRVIRTDSAETLFSFSKSAVAVDDDDIAGGRKALQTAGDLAGREIADQLAASWQRQADRPSVVEIGIVGTSHLADYVKFRKALNSISGVGGIRVKEIKPNETTLQVEYKGKTKELAAALMLQKFDSFGLKISEVAVGLIRIEIVKG